MLVVTLACIAGLTRISFDSSLESLTVPDDPARLFFTEVSERFGTEEIGVVALVADDVYTPEVLESLRELTESVAAIDGVSRVLSLASASDPAADVLDPPPLLARGKITARSIRDLRERLLANPIYVPHLISEDAGAVAVTVFFKSGQTASEQAVIDSAIVKIVERYAGSAKIYYTGMTHIRVRAVQMMQADLLGFLPLSLLCMVLVLWLAFRSFRAVLLPLTSIALGVGALLGLMGWIGTPITLPTLVLPSLLLVIGGSYSVHVSAAMIDRHGKVDKSSDPVAVVDRLLDRVALPVTVSAITTAVGFGALALHPIPAISGLGIYAVLGIAVMASGCLLGLPLAFIVVPERRADAVRFEDKDPQDRLIDRLAIAAADFGIRRRRSVFAVAMILVVIAAVGASKVEVDTDFLSAFRADSDVRIANEAIAESLAGTSPISVVIEGPEPGYFRSIVALRRVKDFQDFVEESDGVDATISLVDYLEELDLGLQAAGSDLVVTETGDFVEGTAPPSFWQAPASQLPAIFQLVSLSPQTFSGMVTPDFKTLRITVRTSATGSRATKALMEEISTYAFTMFPLGVHVRPTGNLVVMSEVSDRVLGGQVESLALAFGAIFAILALLFLSLRVGLAAMIPNALPVLAFFGVMGWAGVPLNLATSIIAAVALGIAVDDTIHYMAHLNRQVKTAKTQREALLMTMRDIGRPVVTTSLTLTAGFLVMVFSGFVVISQFGWLSAMTMMIALATNVVLLPAILATVPVISVWDLVAFRLGESPHKTIPLFHDLGRLGVRLVVLMGRLKEFAADEHIVVCGEPGHEMYLVLTGRAEVVGSDGKTVLAELKRGDVVGEMALLRSTVRTADVVASEAVEVLVIDEDFLRRLRTRYPRFAARFFVNIARILSDRLETANRRLGLVG